MAKHLKPLSVTSKNRVRAFFDTITDKEVTAQKRYWILKYPQSHRDIRNRWMFAYASVHTSWENNVSQYNQLKNKALCDYSDLLLRLTIGGGGMYNLKAKGLFHFGTMWRGNINRFTQMPANWTQSRNNLANQLMQLKQATTSYAYEMNWPPNYQAFYPDPNKLPQSRTGPTHHPTTHQYNYIATQ